MEFLTDEQVDELQTHYQDLENPNCCNWPRFLHDAESGKTKIYRSIRSILCYDLNDDAL